MILQRRPHGAEPLSERTLRVCGPHAPWGDCASFAAALCAWAPHRGDVGCCLTDAAPAQGVPDRNLGPAGGSGPSAPRFCKTNTAGRKRAPNPKSIRETGRGWVKRLLKPFPQTALFGGQGRAKEQASLGSCDVRGGTRRPGVDCGGPRRGDPPRAGLALRGVHPHVRARYHFRGAGYRQSESCSVHLRGQLCTRAHPEMQ